jgi:hypothetical protein
MASTRKTAAGKATKRPNTAAEEFIEHRRRLAEFRFHQDRDRARRVGVAARERRRLLDTMARKLGLSLERLDALHRADWELLQRQVKAQETAAVALLRQQHARQRVAFRTIMKNRKRLEYRFGNPLLQTCLWRAAAPVVVASFPFTFNEGTAGLDPPAPVAPPPTTGNNLIRFTASAHAAATSTKGLQPVAGTEMVTSHVFRTTARADGLISVTANYAPLGTIFLGAPGDCVGLGGQARAELILFMRVRVLPPGRAPITFPVGDTLTILDEDINAGCAGESRLLPVGISGGDSYQVTNPDVGAVAEGETIEVTAGYSLTLRAASRGNAMASFATTTAPFFGLNVPVVIVKIAT